MKTEKFKEENERAKGQRNFLALVFCKFDSKKTKSLKVTYVWIMEIE